MHDKGASLPMNSNSITAQRAAAESQEGAVDPSLVAEAYNLGVRDGILQTLYFLTGEERATLIAQVPKLGE